MTETPPYAIAIQNLKEQRGLTTGQIAAALDSSIYTVAQWVRGATPPRRCAQWALLDLERARDLSGVYLEMTKPDGAEAYQRWRIDRGLTHKAVAEGLGIDLDVVYGWGRGRRPLKVIEARALREYARELRRSQPRPRR